MLRARGWLACALAAGVVAGAAGCGGGTAQQSARGDGEIAVAINSGISTYDPALACNTQYDYWIVKNTYDTLVQYSPKKGADGRRAIVPMLAKRWTISPDGLRYTFHLRDDVRFVSGNPMTAADVVYGLRRVLAKEGCQAYVMTLGDAKSIGSVRAIDPQTVRITLTAPNPIFLGQLTQTGLSPVDSKELAAHGGMGKAGDAWLARHTAGTGAYRIAHDEPDSQVDLAARKDYWQGRPSNNKVAIKIVTDATTLETLVRSGETDMAYGVPVKDTKALSQGRKLINDPGPYFMYLGMNAERAPFDDVRVRQAVAASLDRPALVERLGYGQLEAFDGPMPPAMPFSPKLKAPGADLGAARKLIEQAGAKGATFSVDIKSGETFQREVAVVLQATLADLGITMKIRTLGASAFFDRVASFKSQAYLIRDGSPFNDPAYFLGFFVKCGNDFNWTKYCDKRVDELLAKGKVETDPTARAAQYRELSEIVVRDRPVVPLFALGTNLIAGANLRGYVSYDDQQPVFWPMTAG